MTVLGEIDEHGAALLHREAGQAGSAAGDGEGEVQSEPGLEGLRRPTQHADGAPGPETFDEPAVFFRLGFDVSHPRYGKRSGQGITCRLASAMWF